MTERTAALLGTWGRPPDALATAALGTALALAIAVVLGRGRSIFSEREVPRRAFLVVCAFCAALASLAWVSIYLRGGPRIIDATTYFLQGRALSQGDFTWSAPEPSASFRGRFLVYRDGSLGGIFPPGYPLLLAFGFAIDAPMIVGPLLAAAIVLATYALARAIAEEVASQPLVEPIARGAALLSVACAALRYHTADTMSHGATALGVAVALVCALRGRALLAGLAVGWVFATRPVSALPIGIVVGALLNRRALARALVGTAPGVLLLLASQRAVTGSWLASTQRMYYTLSDGPPGCFRWGFGEGVGCLGEHGEFVRARLPRGYGLLAAAATTLRRLRLHLLDVANLEPLALLVLVPAIVAKRRKRRARGIAAATSLVGLQVLAYAPFYFDGNYPGGGARFFADVLPVEHALVAVALGLVAARAFVRASLATMALALAGFAVHASFEHEKLANRDGGRPMFEPDILARANAREGLVYVATDHGFDLGYDPSARTKDGIVVARLRNDDRDRLLFDRLDHPPTWRYDFQTPPGATSASPILVPWAPPEIGRTLRFEAEAEWPPLSQEGGFAFPAFVEGCASQGRALVLTPAAATMRALITVPVPTSGRYAITLYVVKGALVPFTDPTGKAGPDVRQAAGEARLGFARWTWADHGRGCAALGRQTVELAAPSATLVLEAQGGPVAVDRVVLERD